MIPAFLKEKLSHRPASFCALFTCFCTFFTMFCILLRTFLGTCIANVCANFTDLFCFAASEAHQLRRCITDSCAFHV